jgi:hypothetical protein
MAKTVKRVDVFSYNDNVLFFRLLDDFSVVGVVRTHRIYLNGEKVPASK